MANLNTVFAIAAFALFNVTFVLVSAIVNDFNGVLRWKKDTILGLLATACFSTALVFFHISCLRISNKHTMSTAILTYIFMYLIELKSIFLTNKEMEEGWEDPQKAQEVALQKLLQRNKNTEYGKRYDFDTISSLNIFRDRHPLTKYEHYRADIERMSTGERNVLLKEKPQRYCISSGTTGKSKILPVSKNSDSMFLNCIFYAMTMHRRYVFPQRSILQTGVYFYTHPTARETQDGTRLGPASGMDATQRFFSSLMYSSPVPALAIRDPNASHYIHLLFGLKERNVGFLQATLSSRIFTAFRQLERDWKTIVRDIERGSLDKDLDIPDDIRSELDKIMSPDQKRADELRIEFEKGFKGIIKRVWPYVFYINAVDIAGYGDILRADYAEGLPLYNPFYGSTEVPIIGLELNQNSSNGSNDYIMIPTYAVFEFIPEELMDEEQPNTLFIEELEIGKNYELVLTGLNGMYRFRVGDVIQVSHYHQKCPVIKFQYRSGLVLNVLGEKLDSATLHDVVTETMSHWPTVTVVDYTAAESQLLIGGIRSDNVNPFYVIFIEIDHGKDSKTDTKNMFAQLTGMIDSTLCAKSFTYKSYREKGDIAPPQVHLVKEGSFNKLYTYILNNSTTTANQFKNPRKLRTPEMMDLMMGNIEGALLK